jgi:hypothetical protein
MISVDATAPAQLVFTMDRVCHIPRLKGDNGASMRIGLGHNLVLQNQSKATTTTSRNSFHHPGKLMKNAHCKGEVR